MKIYNTLSRKKEEFIPIKEGEVKIYVCGPTVYNFFHIGNARPFVVFDTLRRYLEYIGYRVDFVQNFTDVDDKIINKAREENVSPAEVSEKYIDEYFKDAQALKVKKATVHPKVTDNIENIIAFVKTLVDKGHAYEVDGDVYFSTGSFPEYGKLSRQNIEDLEIGARIDVGEQKKDPLDFALWKARKSEDEIAWESPWGPGRPGWHIECSAMSKDNLGATIDIHAGGQDLIFPHHENEIAQSECCNGVPFARYWMHNGYITIDKEKMSKSKGNFFTVRDILKDYDGEVIRFFLLLGHYRNPIDFSDKLMEQAKSALARINNCRLDLEHIIANGAESASEAERGKLTSFMKHKDNFIAAMDDDLNTADAIAAIFELVSDINTALKESGSGVSAGQAASKEFAGKSLELLLELTAVLGILESADSEADSKIPADIQELVDERQEARKNKDFARADEIRDALKARGYLLKDTPQGVQVIKE